MYIFTCTQYEICILYACYVAYGCMNGWLHTYVATMDVLLQPTCSLHFHMGSSKDYSQIGVYSRNSAPGIIVAHGKCMDIRT